MDVAVKMLHPTATETDRIKFLQEAAIMGQFHHPNIVMLHGVVTVVEPVSPQLLHTFLFYTGYTYLPNPNAGHDYTGADAKW